MIYDVPLANRARFEKFAGSECKFDISKADPNNSVLTIPQRTPIFVQPNHIMKKEDL